MHIFGYFLYPAHPVQKAVFSVQVKMHKVRIFHSILFLDADNIRIKTGF